MMFIGSVGAACGLALSIIIGLIEIPHDRLLLDTKIMLMLGTIILHVCLPAGIVYFLGKLYRTRYVNCGAYFQKCFFFAAEGRIWDKNSKQKCLPDDNSYALSEHPNVNCPDRQTATINANSCRQITGLVAPIVIIFLSGGVLPLIFDSQLTYDQLHNETMKNETELWRARAWCRVLAYGFECLLIPYAIGWLLYIYYSIKKRCNRITRAILTNENQYFYRDLQNWMWSLLPEKERPSVQNEFSNETPVEVTLVKIANVFATLYFVICILFNFSYFWFVRTWADKIMNDFLGKFIGQLISYTCLMVYMWSTNMAIDKIKETVNRKIVLSAKEVDTTTDDINRILASEIITNHFNPYATILGKKLSFISVLLALISSVVPQMIAYAIKRLQIFSP